MVLDRDGYVRRGTNSPGRGTGFPEVVSVVGGTYTGNRRGPGVGGDRPPCALRGWTKTDLVDWDPMDRMYVCPLSWDPSLGSGFTSGLRRVTGPVRSVPGVRT